MTPTIQTPKLIWTERYSVGVEEIDSQHRALLDILNLLNRAAEKDLDTRRAKDLLWAIFEELNDYAAYHFLSEENLMQEHLPTASATARHIAQHRHYWVAIAEFKNRYRDGDSSVVADLVKFINTWLIEHIQGTDKQLGAELNRQGVR